MNSESENHILAVAAPAIIPLIRKRQNEVLARLVGTYRSGTADLRSIVGEYVCYVELIRDIEVRINNYEKQQGE